MLYVLCGELAELLMVTLKNCFFAQHLRYA